MNWKQFLTEKVLHECWHIAEQIKFPDDSDYFRCSKCKFPMRRCSFRAFDNEADMMEVYRAIYNDGKWKDFITYSNDLWWKDAGLYQLVEEAVADYSAWLFCLDKTGYEDRCKMVSEFYGWEGEK